MKLKIFLTGMILLLVNAISPAQSYDQSAGVRLGHTSGFTYKKFIEDEKAFEFLLSGRRNGLQVTGYYINHLPVDLSFNDRFYFYYGLGAHIGTERYFGYRKELDPTDPRKFSYLGTNFFTMGIDGVLGAEYRIPSLPVTVALDVKPYFNYIGLRYTHIVFWDTAFSVKYIF